MTASIPRVRNKITSAFIILLLFLDVLPFLINSPRPMIIAEPTANIAANSIPKTI